MANTNISVGNKIRKDKQYRVIQNLGPPSQDETGKVLVKPTITPCNITKSKWGAQKSRSETSLPGQNGHFTEKWFYMEYRGIFAILPHLPLHICSLRDN